AQHVLLDAGRVDDIAIKIEERLAVWKIERRRRVDLSPDEHVFRGQRDLLVTVTYVGADVGEDLLARQIDLRVQVRDTELAAPATSRRHLDHAERGARVGKENRVPCDGMADVELARQRLAGNRFLEERKRL